LAKHKRERAAANRPPAGVLRWFLGYRCKESTVMFYHARFSLLGRLGAVLALALLAGAASAAPPPPANANFRALGTFNAFSPFFGGSASAFFSFNGRLPNSFPSGLPAAFFTSPFGAAASTMPAMLLNASLMNQAPVFNPWANMSSLTATPYSPSGLYPGTSNSGMYPGSYNYGESPYRGFLSGNAAVITSVGNYRMDYERYRLAREQVRQAQIDTRRRAFDEYLYERAHAPTTEDLREQAQREQVRRSLNAPPATEVLSARSLNDLLADVQKLPSSAKGPDVPLDEDLLKRINVVPTQGHGNPGLLREARRLRWPAALRNLPPEETTAELRDQIDGLLHEALGQAANGRLQPALLQELSRAVIQLGKLLTDHVQDVPTTRYIEARRFLSDLDDAIKILRQPDAADYLNGKYTAKGRTVQQLIQYMTEHGLRFAPAVPGDEPAYTALHEALARYDTAVKSAGKR
jgi:hypothetical protein